MSRSRERRKKAERVAWGERKRMNDEWVALQSRLGYHQTNLAGWSPNGTDYDPRFYECRDGLWYRKTPAEAAQHGKVWKDQWQLGIIQRRERKAKVKA